MGIFQSLFGGHDQGGRLVRLHEALEADLNLNVIQTKQMRDAFQKFRAQRKEIKTSGGGVEQIQLARKQLEDDIMGILNDEQQKIFISNAARYENILRGEKE
jgi:hypothetical protein